MIFKYFNCVLHNYIQHIHNCVINGCPIFNCMIHYNVCNDKSKMLCNSVGQWKLLWVDGDYCGRLNLVIPLAHRAFGFKT